jgi:hypothetical protein
MKVLNMQLSPIILYSPDIVVIILFSNILDLYSSVKVSNKIHTHTKQVEFLFNL